MKEMISFDVEWRQPEASPAEYARANKELRKLRGSTELIAHLRIKQKVLCLILYTVDAECYWWIVWAFQNCKFLF